MSEISNITEEVKEERLFNRKKNAVAITGRLYEYKGHFYERKGECQTKNSVDGIWEEGIMYKDILQPQLYTRLKTDFENKFVKIAYPIL